MTDLFQQDFYKNFKKMLLIRLCITIGFPLFYSIKAFIIDTYSIDKSFLTGYIIFSNIVVACGLIGCFIYASNRKNSYISGNIKTRFENYLKATMYRYSAMEISPALFMICFAWFGRPFFVLEAIAFYILLGFYFPTKKRLSKDLKLDIN
jgi:hypothetical protein